MEAFLAIQAMCGAEQSDSESVRSDISETLGALSFQRRPGSGRRKKQVPLRSPLDAGVSTECTPQDIPKGCLQTRFGLFNDAETSDPATPVAAAVADTPFAEPTAVSTPNTPTPNIGIRNKKTKQDLAGPCCHCNATNSPQWRKGPKGKPILCNACGIRFLRTRTLGKAAPKKRRAPTTTAGSTDLGNTQNKRIRTDEPSTEEDDYEVGTDEPVTTDDAVAAAAAEQQAEETHSNSRNNIDHNIRGLASLSAAAAAGGQQAPHAQQYRMSHCSNMPTSRLAIASSAELYSPDDLDRSEAAAAAPDQADAYQQQCNQTYGQTYGQRYSRSADDREVEHYSEQLAEQYTGSTAAAAAAVNYSDLVPQYGWPAVSVHRWGPQAAAASGQDILHDQALLLAAAATASQSAGASTANHSRSGGTSNAHGVPAPVTTGMSQPLAAGSRLLLGASSSNAVTSSRLDQSPTLAYTLQPHGSSSNPLQQQQHTSIQGLGLYNHLLNPQMGSGCTGSPMSHSSAFPSHLRAEYSGFSLASGSPPASPLTSGAAAAAAAGASSSGLQHNGFGGRGGGGFTQQQYQQQQHGMHRPSPLSVIATAADLAQHAAMSARQFHAATSALQHADLAQQAATAAAQHHAAAAGQSHAATSAQQHADLAHQASMSAGHFHAATSAQQYADLAADVASQTADLAAAEAAAATVHTQPAHGTDLLQLMRHMASALGGVGPTWNLLQSLQSSGSGGPNAAAAAALGLLNSA